MPIKNYTTKIDVYTSLGEIQGALARNGATKIMIDYEDQKPIAISFALNTAHGMRGFQLPARPAGVASVFAKQKVKADREQAERTEWRNIRDWVLAQMALVESNAEINVDEVFLPYLADKTGKTLYQAYQGGQLLLGDGEPA